MSRRKRKGGKKRKAARAAKARQRKRAQKADSVFTHGPLRLSQSGNVVMLENSMTEEECQAWRKELATQYPVVCEEIAKHVAECCKIVASCSPLSLLIRLYWHDFSLALGGPPEESQLSHDRLLANRALDYAQSLVLGVGTDSDVAAIGEKDFQRFLTHVSRIYEILGLSYFLARSGFHSQQSGYDEEKDMFAVQAEMHWLTVRGDRYLCHDAPHLRELLSYQSTDLERAYGVTNEQIADGVEKLLESLTKGIGHLMDDLESFQNDTMNAIDKVDDDTTPLTDLMQKVVRKHGWEDRSKSILGRLHGADLFCIEELTGWPHSFIESLSLSAGQDADFADGSDRHAWPTQFSQVRNKPFLRHEDKSYCFSVYGLTDNIYRAIQKNLSAAGHKQAEQWNKNQQRATEQRVLATLGELLPKARILPSVHYEALHTEKSAMQWAESDGLVIFDRHLFIVEVKAGAYTQRPPGKHIAPHIDAIKKLVRDASKQADRLYRQLMTAEEVTICDSKHNTRMTIRRGDFDHIVRCCVTLDQLEHITSHIEDASRVGIDVGTLPLWCVSLNDLRVYRDVFQNPLVFLDFVLERVRAFASPKCHVIDEMDHLGLYLTHNRYVARAEGLGFEVEGGWAGYRDTLDCYYAERWKGETCVPPQQEMPLWLLQTLNCLAQSRSNYRARAAQLLLSMNGTARNELATHIERILEIQKAQKRPRPLSLIGEVRITVFAAQKGLVWSDFDEAKEHTLATMSLQQEEDRFLLWLQYGKEQVMESAKWAFLTNNDIDSGNQAAIQKRVDLIRSSREKLSRADKIDIERH